MSNRRDGKSVVLGHLLSTTIIAGGAIVVTCAMGMVQSAEAACTSSRIENPPGVFTDAVACAGTTTGPVEVRVGRDLPGTATPVAAGDNAELGVDDTAVVSGGVRVGLTGGGSAQVDIDGRLNGGGLAVSVEQGAIAVTGTRIDIDSPARGVDARVTDAASTSNAEVDLDGRVAGAGAAIAIRNAGQGDSILNGNDDLVIGGGVNITSDRGASVMSRVTRVDGNVAVSGAAGATVDDNGPVIGTVSAVSSAGAAGITGNGASQGLAARGAVDATVSGNGAVAGKITALSSAGTASIIGNGTSQGLDARGATGATIDGNGAVGGNVSAMSAAGPVSITGNAAVAGTMAAAAKGGSATVSGNGTSTGIKVTATGDAAATDNRDVAGTIAATSSAGAARVTGNGTSQGLTAKGATGATIGGNGAVGGNVSATSAAGPVSVDGNAAVAGTMAAAAKGGSATVSGNGTSAGIKVTATGDANAAGNGDVTGSIAVTSSAGAASIAGNGTSQGLTAKGVTGATVDGNGAVAGMISASATNGTATVRGNGASDGIVATGSNGAVVESAAAVNGAGGTAIDARSSAGDVEVGVGGAIQGAVGIAGNAAGTLTVTVSGTGSIVASAVGISSSATSAVVTNNGTITAPVVVRNLRGTLSFANNSGFSANGGFTSAAGTVTTVTNSASGHWTVTAAGPFALRGTDTFDNAGHFDVTTPAGAPASFVGLETLANLAGGTFDVGPGMGLDFVRAGTFSNAGTVSVGIGGVLSTDAAVTNSATLTNHGSLATGSFGNTGLLANDGSAAVAGFVNGAGGIVANSGTGSLTTQAFDNFGTLLNTAGASVSTRAFVNEAGATIVNAGSLTTNGRSFANAGTLGSSGTLSTGAFTNAASVTNSGTATTGAFTNDAGATVNNAGAGSQLTTAGFVNRGSVDNTGANSRLVTLNFDNFGRLFNTGAGASVSTRAFTNEAGGVVGNAGSLSTNGRSFTNAGTLNSSGTLSTGAFTNMASVTNSGSFATASFINEAGATVDNAATGSHLTTQAFVNRGTADNSGAGAVLETRSFDNFGLLANGGTGASVGTQAFTNEAGATVANAASLTTNGRSFTNDGTVTSSGDLATGAFRNAGSVTNSGTATTDGFANDAGATVSNVGTGASLTTQAFVNRGTTDNSGTDAVLDTQRFDNFGSLRNTGTGASVNTQAFTNEAGGTVANSMTMTTGAFTNAGTVNQQGGSFTVQSLNNRAAGTITATGGSFTVAANAVNNGRYDMINGNPTDLVTVNGNFAGTGTIGFDVDLRNLVPGQVGSDILDIRGSTAGASNAVRLDLMAGVNANGDTTIGYHAPVSVIKRVDGADGAFYVGGVDVNCGSFAACDAPALGGVASEAPFDTRKGTLLYQEGFIQQWFGFDRGTGSTDPNSQDFDYVVKAATDLKSFGQLTGAVLATMAFSNASYSEPASALVVRKRRASENQVNFGAFLRTRGGSFDTDSHVSDLGGSGRSLGLTVSTDFIGTQGGVDMNVGNVLGSGWGIDFGLIAGEVQTWARSGSTDLDVELPFGGVYVVAYDAGGFSLDGQIRYDTYRGKVTSASVPGLEPKTKLDATGVSGLVNAQYTFPVGAETLGFPLYVEPSVAVLFNSVNLDDLDVTAGQRVSFDGVESTIGRAGVQFSTAIPTGQAEDILLLPNVGATVFHEFAGDATAQLVGTPLAVASDRVGTFGQVGGGLTVSSVSLPVNAYARGDYRFGDQVSGYTISAGVRMNF